MKILCVEDDKGLATLLQQALIKQHYQVELATDGLVGWALAEADTYDLILLDWILPQLTGIEICQRLRTEKYSVLNPNRDTPILLMTALESITNKVMGLNAGADDYIVKPFDLDELLARVRALLRRHQAVRTPMLRWGEVCLNPNTCEVTYQSQPVMLAAKEYELLELFLRNAEQIFSLERLLSSLWAIEEAPSYGAVRAHIKGLRHKLKKAGADDPIETIYKLGYRLKPQTSQQKDKPHQAWEEGTVHPSESSASPFTELLDFSDVWQEVSQSYRDRLFTIQQAILALQNQTLTTQQQQVAEREAHTLVGSLGSFGLEKASHLSRQIQQMLRRSGPFEQGDIGALLQWVAALERLLENPLGIAGKSDGIEPPGSIPSLFPATLENPLSWAITSKDGLEPPLAASDSVFSAPCLLIVDHDPAWFWGLEQEVVPWGVHIEIVTTLKAAQHSLQSHFISALLLNLDLSGPDGNSLEFLTALCTQLPALPVITMTARASFAQRLEVAKRGVRGFFTRASTPAQIFGTIAPLIQSSHAPPVRILLLDKNQASLQLLGSLLEAEGYQPVLLSDPQQFWQALEQTAPDLVILEVAFPGLPLFQSDSDSASSSCMSGLEICRAIRCDPDWNRLPVIFLSASTDSATVQSCFAAGADDFLSKPFAFQDVLTRVRTRLEQRKCWGLWGDRPTS